MRHIADKMADAFLSCCYWMVLEELAENYKLKRADTMQSRKKTSEKKKKVAPKKRKSWWDETHH